MDIDEMANAAMGFAMYDNFRKAMDKQSVADDEGAPRPARTWYVILQGRQNGPFSLGELVSMASSGSISSATYVWKQGMEDWIPASSVAELSSVFQDHTKTDADESQGK